jgi:hypothetical protein
MTKDHILVEIKRTTAKNGGKEELLKSYANLAVELGRLPLEADLRMRAKHDSEFPSHTSFAARLGSKLERVELLLKYCRANPEFAAITPLCEEYKSKTKQPKSNDSSDVSSKPEAEIGYVYLIKSGRFYRISHTTATGQREYELVIQLSEKLSTVHTICSDDPLGIEAYWHNRFNDKRKNGEWFELDAADVAAFKRRNFM